MPIPQRYEAVPQRDDTILLDSLDSSNYNYNSAIPNSVSAPSVPGSPPPSFHSRQSIPSSPGTPRPTLRGGHDSFSGLWNINQGSDGTAITTASDASLAIALLRGRVERLEESLGRLLMEKETARTRNVNDTVDTNCCVTFSGVGSDDEEFLRAKSNCCVTFSGSRESAREKKERKALRIIVATGVLILVLLVVIVLITSVNASAKAASACSDSCR